MKAVVAREDLARVLTLASRVLRMHTYGCSDCDWRGDLGSLVPVPVVGWDGLPLRDSVPGQIALFPTSE